MTPGGAPMMLRHVQCLRSHLIPLCRHVQPMQPDCYPEGLGMIHDPHISCTLKGDVWYIRLQVRQERFCCFWQYWGLGRGDSGATHEVVFCNHADHLISKAPSIMRQHVGVQMPYRLPSYSIPRQRLFHGMVIEFHDCGVPTLRILEGEG